MKLIRNNPDFLLSYDDDFVMLQSTNMQNQETYVFYNSITHRGIRLSKLELTILELVYKYDNDEFVINNIADKHRAGFRQIINKIRTEKLLCKEFVNDTSTEGRVMPSLFYLHLTDSCNLRCTYCYNQEQRKKHNQISFLQWQEIINKIIPFAERIVLTGGECFLHPQFGSIIKSLKDKKPTLNISCITNGMFDYDRFVGTIDFGLISDLIFSCDSITRELNRKGFNPRKFKTNILFFRKNYPNINIIISATHSIHNKADLDDIILFSRENGCHYRAINLIPGNTTDISDMPHPISLLYEKCITPNYILEQRNIGCGAGKTICSINSDGAVYPCQALHYDEFYMGNILETDLIDMRFVKDQTGCLPSVDEIEGCKSCNLRYICGGGCLATSYPTNDHTFKRNRLICPFNKTNALLKLSQIKNLSSK